MQRRRPQPLAAAHGERGDRVDQYARVRRSAVCVDARTLEEAVQVSVDALAHLEKPKTRRTHGAGLDRIERARQSAGKTVHWNGITGLLSRARPATLGTYASFVLH